MQVAAAVVACLERKRISEGRYLCFNCEKETATQIALDGEGQAQYVCDYCAPAYIDPFPLGSKGKSNG